MVKYADRQVKAKEEIKKMSAKEIAELKRIEARKAKEAEIARLAALKEAEATRLLKIKEEEAARLAAIKQEKVNRIINLLEEEALTLEDIADRTGEKTSDTKKMLEELEKGGETTRIFDYENPNEKNFMTQKKHLWGLKKKFEQYQ